MFGMGMTELLVILAVALLVLGPKRLPSLAADLGKAIREFRKATRDLSNQIELDESVRQPIQELRAALRDEPAPKPVVATSVVSTVTRTEMAPSPALPEPATPTSETKKG